MQASIPNFGGRDKSISSHEAVLTTPRSNTPKELNQSAWLPSKVCTKSTFVLTNPHSQHTHIHMSYKPTFTPTRNTHQHSVLHHQVQSTAPLYQQNMYIHTPIPHYVPHQLLRHTAQVMSKDMAIVIDYSKKEMNHI